MDYTNLQTENNFNYPVFQGQSQFQSNKPIKAPEVPIQTENKNDLKECLLPKDVFYGDFKQQQFNYVEPKNNGFSINSIEPEENNNKFVESKQYQLNFSGSHQVEPEPKKQLVSTNFVVQNESCSFSNNIQNPNNQVKTCQKTQQVNYSFNNAGYPSQVSSNTYTNDNSYNNTNYRPISNNQHQNNVYNQQPTYQNYNQFPAQQQNKVNYNCNPYTTPQTYSFQPQPQIQNTYNTSPRTQQTQTQSFNYVTVLPNQQVPNNVSNNLINNNSNVISYSFNKTSQTQSSIKKVSKVAPQQITNKVQPQQQQIAQQGQQQISYLQLE
jgi:hypothetical protein